MSDEFQFDIAKFLAKDCKEEQKVSEKITISMFSKAYKKGVTDGYKYGLKDGVLQSNYTNMDVIRAIEWYNKIMLNVDHEYNIYDVLRMYKKYKG